jgi:hypothetical protein
VPEANTKHPNGQGCGGPPESEGLRMRGKRYVEELGRPHRLLPEGHMVVRSPAIGHARGNPETGPGWNLSAQGERRARQAEGDSGKGKPTVPLVPLGSDPL